MAKAPHMKTALIEETIRQINRKGLEHISLREIAAACGVTHAAIYRHFPSKQALIEATYPYIWQQLYRSIDQAIVQDSDEEKTILLCKAYLRFMVTYPQYHYLMNVLPTLSPPGHIPGTLTFRSYMHHYGGIIMNFLARCGIPPEEQIGVAQLCSAMLDGMATLLIKKRIRVTGDYTRLVDRLMVRELKLYPKEPPPR